MKTVYENFFSLPNDGVTSRVSVLINQSKNLLYSKTDLIGFISWFPDFLIRKCLLRFYNYNNKSNKKASTLLCFVVKHLGVAKAKRKLNPLQAK